MKEKLLYIIFIVLYLLPNISFAQETNNYSINILNYYFPFENNKSTFVFVSYDGTVSDWWTRTICYIENYYPGGITYTTLKWDSMEVGITGVTEDILEVSSNQISITNSKYSDPWKPGKLLPHEINPPRIILKLPKIGKVEKWKYEEPGCKWECQAEFTKVLIDGTERNAIRVYEKPFLDGKYGDDMAMYYFYVDGIGLWKTQMHNGTDFMILKEQSYDSSIND